MPRTWSGGTEGAFASLDVSDDPIGRSLPRHLAWSRTWAHRAAGARRATRTGSARARSSGVPPRKPATAPWPRSRVYAAAAGRPCPRVTPRPRTGTRGAAPGSSRLPAAAAPRSTTRGDPRPSARTSRAPSRSSPCLSVERVDGGGHVGERRRPTAAPRAVRRGRTRCSTSPARVGDRTAGAAREMARVLRLRQKPPWIATTTGRVAGRASAPGARRPARAACRTGGWCGAPWHGTALRPRGSPRRAPAL